MSCYSQNVPLSIPPLYFQTSHLLSRLGHLYLSPAAIKAVCVGQPMQSVGRLRYLFLPKGTMDGRGYRRRLARLLGVG